MLCSSLSSYLSILHFNFPSPRRHCQHLNDPHPRSRASIAMALSRVFLPFARTSSSCCHRRRPLFTRWCLLSLWWLCIVTRVSAFNLENRLPIVKYGPNADSYFGYSIAPHTIGEYNWPNNTKWLLVGAPLDKNLQPGTNHSGALYKCPITERYDDCEQIITDGRRTFCFLHPTNIANSEPSESQYVDIGKDFRSLWNMPNYLGQSMGNMLRFHAPKIQEAHISTIKTFIALSLWRRVTRCALLLP